MGKRIVASAVLCYKTPEGVAMLGFLGIVVIVSGPFEINTRRREILTVFFQCDRGG